MRFRKIHGAGNDFVLLSDPGPDGPTAARNGPRKRNAYAPGVPA